MNKPFICGGYTQQDWDTICGLYIDIEYHDDYCETPLDKHNYVMEITKPSWA